MRQLRLVFLLFAASIACKPIAESQTADRQPSQERTPILPTFTGARRTPIVVVLSQDNCERYLVIDGHKRIVGWNKAGTRSKPSCGR